MCRHRREKKGKEEEEEEKNSRGMPDGCHQAYGKWLVKEAKEKRRMGESRKNKRPAAKRHLVLLFLFSLLFPFFLRRRAAGQQ